MAQDGSETKDKTYEEYKDLEVVELFNKKVAFIKELEKSVKQVSSLDFAKALDLMREMDKIVKQLSMVDVTKSSERSKLTKSLEKISDLLTNMSVLDQVVSEKGKISKALEKISEVAGKIPVIDKVLKEKDF